MKYELKFIGNLRKSASLSRLFDDLLEKHYLKTVMAEIVILNMENLL